MKRSSIPNGIFALLTDFGEQDIFVGAMKGVLLGIAPDALIVDLCHSVPPQNIRVGSLFLGASVAYFPPGTIHLAVVDPGVGGMRGAIAVETDKAFFVAPDNGVLMDALRRQTVRAVVELTETRFFLPNVSQTFHGRDVFAPVAAHLAKGVPIEELGTPLSDYIRLPEEAPVREGNEIRARVLFADRFGNLVTNLRQEDAKERIVCVRLTPSPHFTVSHKGSGKSAGQGDFPLVSSYGSVPPRERLSIWNSFGLLELALNGGNLAAEIGWNESESRSVVVEIREK